jgi:uncharacterized iron-regulated protein
MMFKRLCIAASTLGLLACASMGPDTRLPDSFFATRIQRLLPADAILLGEQHDAPDHQRIHRVTVETLAAQNALSALALEMATTGLSTEQLSPQADDTQTRAALQWNNESWPWAVYGPIVMTAVRAGVPVVGANIATTGLRDVMGNARFDGLLTGPALKAQQQNIRSGHCEMLPESQITPMTRIQIARDVSMADTLVRMAQPGKTVLLLAGRGHVERSLGVAQHLPPAFKAKTLLLGVAPASHATETIATIDQTWPALPAPVIDYCAEFAVNRGAAVPPSSAPTLP